METLKDQLLALRKVINSHVLDDLERMLNASKGAGTTTMLIEKAKSLNVALIVHSETWAEKLIQDHPTLRAKVFTAAAGGEKVLIDNGVNWLLLREAQKLRRMTESLLNYMEVKKIEEKKP